MSKFKFMVTNEGKHPASKWAEITVDDILEITTHAPAALVNEAKSFRKKLVEMLTKHHQYMMDHEQKQLKEKSLQSGQYETEEYADTAVEEICELAKDTSFAKHFIKNDVRVHLKLVLNRYFKSAKQVERQYHQARPEVANSKKVIKE